ncbi:MAG: HDIG domain-containing metalloprotein [Candidatus Brocadiales bacterium]
MNREEAWDLLTGHIRQENLRKHCVATEAIMRSLARELGRDEESWGVAGLLHDLDFESTKDDPASHTLRTADILRDKGIPDDMVEAIKAHNAEALGIERTTEMGFALSAAESITGLIVAAALVLPDKKLSSVKPSSVIKRMQEKAFARNVNRQAIRGCERLGIGLEDFVKLSLTAMQGIASELGL